ncbi:MAG: hypothetical protein ACI90V_009326, partial [Bacillariaceae sp.]
LIGPLHSSYDFTNYYFVLLPLVLIFTFIQKSSATD